MNVGAAFLVGVQVVHLLCPRQVVLHTLVEGVGVGQGPLLRPDGKTHNPKPNTQRNPEAKSPKPKAPESCHPHHTRHNLSAAAASVSSRLAQQKRTTGPGSPQERTGDTGMAATPCVAVSRVAKSASGSSVIAE